MNISLLCPTCGEESEHEVLREAREFTVRCTTCRVTYKISPIQPDEIVIQTIVSDRDHSIVCKSEVAKNEEYSIGDVIVADCGDNSFGVEITSIETEYRRVERAKGSDIKTFWSRGIEEVIVKVSVHSGRSTRPFYLRCDGNDEFTVDKMYSMGGAKVRISHIKLRDGRLIRKKGDKAIAMSIRRIYAFRT